MLGERRRRVREGDMPVYLFKCTRCGETYERRMTVKEREQGPPPCPEGGNPRVPVCGNVSVKTSRKS